MGVMLHLQHAAPNASQIAVGLAIFGLVALVADYVRMLLLRSKMVSDPTTLVSEACCHVCLYTHSTSATGPDAVAHRGQHLPTARRQTVDLL